MKTVDIFAIFMVITGLIQLMVGIIVKIMHWPGAGILLASCAIFMATGLLLLIVRRLRNK